MPKLKANKYCREFRNNQEDCTNAGCTYRKNGICTVPPNGILREEMFYRKGLVKRLEKKFREKKKLQEEEEEAEEAEAEKCLNYNNMGERCIESGCIYDHNELCLVCTRNDNCNEPFPCLDDNDRCVNNRGNTLLQHLSDQNNILRNIPIDIDLPVNIPAELLPMSNQLDFFFDDWGAHQAMIEKMTETLTEWSVLYDELKIAETYSKRALSKVYYSDLINLEKNTDELIEARHLEDIARDIRSRKGKIRKKSIYEGKSLMNWCNVNKDNRGLCYSTDFIKEKKKYFLEALNYKELKQHCDQFGVSHPEYDWCLLKREKALDSETIYKAVNNYFMRTRDDCYKFRKTKDPVCESPDRPCKWMSGKCKLPGTKFYHAVYGHISEWDTSLVSSMAKLFQQLNYDEDELIIPFNENIGNWDTSSVINMDSMFKNCRYFNSPIGRWDTSNVLNMDEMFYKVKFNQDISGWSVSNVKSMDGMFEQSDFNKNIGMWDVRRVESMRRMFKGATSFNNQNNPSIGDWNLPNLVYSSNMFRGAINFNQPINWYMPNLKYIQNMFSANYPLNEEGNFVLG
jgi:surface protein